MVPRVIEAFVRSRDFWMEDTIQRAEGCFIFSLSLSRSGLIVTLQMMNNPFDAEIACAEETMSSETLL